MCPLPPTQLIREVRLAMLFVLNKGNLLLQLICTNNNIFTDFLLDCGSFENEPLENEDRSTLNSKTKHPNLENKVPKTWKRSTQDSKMKHPELENEAPKTQKRSTQISKPL